MHHRPKVPRRRSSTATHGSRVTGKETHPPYSGMIGRRARFTVPWNTGGEATAAPSMDSRFSIANMAIGTGEERHISRRRQDAGLHEEHATRPYKVYASDADATYSEVRPRPMLEGRLQHACPSLPSDLKDAGELGSIDVGSVSSSVPTNGRLIGPGDGGRHPHREEGQQRFEMHRDPRDPRDLRRGNAPGILPDIPGCRLHHIAAHLRPLPGRSHGHTGKGREGRGHNEQELHRKDGASRKRGLPRRSRRGGCHRHQGQDSPS